MSKDINEKIKLLIKGGPEKLQVVSDFDRTLTRQFVDGSETPSVISILRDEAGYLSPDYADKAKALYAKYRPIEQDQSLPYGQRAQAMEEWWNSHYKLLRESGLEFEDIKRAAQSKRLQFRPGCKEFLQTLDEHDIPLVIISSSGLGEASIKLLLERDGMWHKNIYVISNVLEWDKDGKFINAKQPIIHTLNKNEAQAKYFPFFEKIKERRNVLLLGDSVSDLEMIDEENCDVLFKAGFFYSNRTAKDFADFYEYFDLVIPDDGPMECIGKLLQDILE